MYIPDHTGYTYTCIFTYIHLRSCNLTHVYTESQGKCQHRCVAHLPLAPIHTHAHTHEHKCMNE